MRGLLLLAGVLAVLTSGGCSSPRSLEKEPMPLAPDEARSVAGKVEEALVAQEWVTAWNLAAEGDLDRSEPGRRRAALEDVLLGAMGRPPAGADALTAAQCRAGVYSPSDDAIRSMAEALRTKYGGLTAEARTAIDALVAALVGVDGDHVRAATLEVLVADDAPAYARAWRVYAATPAEDALDVFEVIREARQERGLPAENGGDG